MKRLLKLMVTVDEKWPVFDLEVLKDHQIPNIEVSEEFYRRYLYICLEYSKIQEKLREYYEACCHIDCDHDSEDDSPSLENIPEKIKRKLSLN